MASCLLARLLLSLSVRLRIIGAEHTARKDPFILAANHISHFDPTILSVAAHRKIDWMAMAELFVHPLMSLWLTNIDCFPVDRGRPDRAAVRAALDRLKRGHVVGIFPEGGIRDGARSILGGATVKPGVGAIAQLAHVPVVPAIIIGTDRLYAPQAWRPFRRTEIWIVFGPPLHNPSIGKEARTHMEEQLGETLRKLLAELQNRHGLTENDLPQPPARRKGRF
jgi:1-acyl-sn-glycerol-3-phosphate acyltransferase